MGGEEAGLQGVHERYPDQVAKAQHETEAVGSDIHGCENCRLVPEPVEHVPELKGVDENHAIGDAAMYAMLLNEEGKVQERPQDQARAELAEGFEVEGVDARVERTADKPLGKG